MKKDNVAVLIDGFNYYHAIKSHMREVEYTSSLKWLNYDALIRNIILKNKQFKDLKINFYTAKNVFKLNPDGTPHESLTNHDTYMAALTQLGIKVIEGQFKPRAEKLNCYLTCSSCNGMNFVHRFSMTTSSKVYCRCGSEINMNRIRSFNKVEEKKTDVKIAVDLINIARDGVYNKIYLFSTDSDFIPAVEYIKKHCPNVQVYIVAPADKVTMRRASSAGIRTISPFRYNVTEFKDLGLTIIRLKLSKLRHCLLPSNFKGLIDPWL